jgi:restriction endonuclease S subunit
MRKQWEKYKLKNLSEVITKGTTPTSIGFDFTSVGINFIKIESITPDGRFIRNRFAAISGKCNDVLRRSQLKENDILFSIAGALGRTAIVNKEILPANTNQALAIIRLKENPDIFSRFVLLALNLDLMFEQVEKFRGGVAQQNLSLEQLGNFEIPIPPLSEQKRIVEILDEAFAAIDKAKVNVEKNLQNAKELFESYLQNVFANPPSDWENKTLKEITVKIGSGATPKGGNKSYKAEGISLIRSMNVHDFEFREKNLAFIDERQAKELNNVTLQENDVLLNITGASVARCCVIPKKYLPARVNQHVSIIRAKKEVIDPIFLSLLLTSKFYKDPLLFTGEQGATRQAITKAQLEIFRISFPKSLKEQQAVTHKLNAISFKTKKLEAIYQQKLNNLEELKKSILQKAFAGELTAKTLVI